MKKEELFRNTLMKWHREENNRAMPWKGIKDPYKVWLSEIILQQTRVEQGWKYYETFIKNYPTVQQLARAKEEDVFKLWEGLGYYTRCRNLLHTAKFIYENYDGEFPSSYDAILNLKGVGAYTASAIASFCFNLPHAVVDGNVFRVLARYFGIDLPIDSTDGKKKFTELAQACLDKKKPGGYNQSIMDFGATVCKPVPLCSVCVLNDTCTAFKKNHTQSLPVKLKKNVKRERWFSYFVFSFNSKTFIRLRTAKDIWQNLYEFYLEETMQNPEWNDRKAERWLTEKLNIRQPKSISITQAKKQLLTHQLIHGYFIRVELSSDEINLLQQGIWVNNNTLHQKAFPKFIHQFTGAKTLQLQVF